MPTFKLLSRVVVLIGGSCLLCANVLALGTETHRLVNIQAARTQRQGNVDDVLRANLGFPEGRATLLTASGRTLTIEEWLGEGGIREDDRFRYLRHFHDPLRPWDVAGLDIAIDRFDSSIRWMQHPLQSTGGFWSWGDARRLYYEALTEPNPVRREALWADVFRALGQIMHLVVDASVPEHVRNDVHLLGALKLGNSYERWVGSQHGGGNSPSEALFIARYLSAPIGFISDILQVAPPAAEHIAMVPVARLIDADRYDGTNPGITVDGADHRAPVSVGLAEIANANFFSEDTLRGQYPFPTDEGLIAVNLATPLGRVRRYFSRPGGLGLLPANPLRAECAADVYYQRGDLVEPPPYPCTDALVWSQVAAHMLPRAVGYARGVLDYFFRGSMRVDALYTQGENTFIRIQNLSDEAMEGVFEVHARPTANTTHEGREKVGLVNGGAVINLSPNAAVTLPVTLLSAEHPTASQLLVFHGRLGLEQDGVAAQVFEVRHLLITQTAAAAAMSESCNAFDYYSFEKGSYCDWRASSHDVQGELLADARVPVIARVSAAWETTTGKKSAQIELDEVPIPGGVWQREGTEPDPRRFRIIAGANQGNRLVLRVQLVSGETVATPMAVLAFASASSKTHYTNPTFYWETGPWWVSAERNASTLVFVHPPFRALSIGGHPNPTSIYTQRFGVDSLSLREHFLVRDEIRGASYLQRWIDSAQVFTTAPPGGPVELRPILEALFQATPVSPLPAVLLEAEVERVYEPAELQFLKTFVTSVPPPHTFTMVGRLPGT